MNGAAYDKANKIVGEIQRHLQADCNPAQFLRKMCDFLQKQKDKPLKDIGDSIRRHL